MKQSAAVISDIHGNVTALKRVLEDIRQRKISEIICLGDLIGKGPASCAAIDICREECSVVLKGNWDDAVTFDHIESDFVRWFVDQIDDERKDYLASLPGCHHMVMGNKRVRLYHASQKSMHVRVHMYEPQETHYAMFEHTEFTGNGKVLDIVGYGDIHSTYLKTMGGKILFNAGSVGNPLDLNKASYAIIEADGDDVEIRFIRLSYDIEKELKIARDSGMAYYEKYEHELRTGSHKAL